MTRQHRLAVRQAEDPHERREGCLRCRAKSGHQRPSSRKKQARLEQSTSTTMSVLTEPGSSDAAAAAPACTLASSSVNKGISARTGPRPDSPCCSTSSTFRRHMALVLQHGLLLRLLDSRSYASARLHVRLLDFWGAGAACSALGSTPVGRCFSLDGGRLAFALPGSCFHRRGERRRQCRGCGRHGRGGGRGHVRVHGVL